MNISNFRDSWLDDFFENNKGHKKIPATISGALARKLDIINAATCHRDLRSPPGNRFEPLNPPLGDYFSIRVNGQYRLIFKWVDGKAVDLYLDSHTYKATK
jgi:proteic killer suppression protein